MFAMTFDDDRNFVWREVADPVRKADEVLIEVHAAALNRADLLQREGNYPPPPGWPEWPGLEVAGVVMEAPSGARFAPGMKVCALLGGGGYAERVAAPAGMTLPVPENVGMAEAAAIPEVFATAWLNLIVEGGMKPGDTVFIQAGASGLGLAAIQLADRWDCRVLTTVGSSEKAAFVRGLGADVAVNHRKDDLAARLRENPPDIALDCVGGPGLSACLEAMAPGGRWIVLATLGGARSEIDLGVLFRKRVRLIGSSLRSRTTEEKAALMAALEKNLWPRFASGELRSVIHRILPMREAEEAHRILRDRENIGKVALTLPPR